MGKGGGILKPVTSMLYGSDSEDAAQGAALAQQDAAQRNYRNVEGIVNKSTLAGLADYDKALGAQERSLANQEKLIAQIDPTIIEASQQALRLLRGESSSSLAPAQAQRDMQRQKLMNSLREQLGPGAETSTAGIQALTRFDAETNSLLAGQQQSALQNVGSIFGQFSNSKPSIANEATTFGNLAGAKAGLGFQQANALNAANQGVQQTAGAQFAGQAVRGAQSQALGNALINAGAQVGGAMAGKPPTASDRRLKKNIRKLDENIYSGVPTYVYEYINEADGIGEFIGVMAQDLLAINPSHPAVTKKNGYYMVDYSKVETL